MSWSSPSCFVDIGVRMWGMMSQFKPFLLLLTHWVGLVRIADTVTWKMHQLLFVHRLFNAYCQCGNCPTLRCMCSGVVRNSLFVWLIGLFREKSTIGWWLIRQTGRKSVSATKQSRYSVTWSPGRTIWQCGSASWRKKMFIMQKLWTNRNAFVTFNAIQVDSSSSQLPIIILEWMLMVAKIGNWLCDHNPTCNRVIDTIANGCWELCN
jgi:hypothetical protein